MGVALFEGGTEIASWLQYDVGDSPTDYAFALTSSEQASIGVWSNLWLEITRGGDVGGATSTHRRLIVSGIWV